MQKQLSFCFILFLYSCLPAIAAEETDSVETERSIVQTVGDDVSISSTDAVNWFLAPLSFSGTDWLYTAGAVGVPVLAITADEDIRTWLQKQESPLNKDVATVVKQYGEIKYASVFALSVYAGGLVFGDDDIRITGRLLGESLLLAGITTQAVKMLAGRSRPYRNDGPWYFAPLQSTNERLSFPSGHATVAFALSSVLSERLDNTWASVGLYSLASLTGLSRVYHNEHWFSDVLLGAVVGTASGLAVTGWETHRNRAGDEHTILLLPSFDGLRVVMKL